MSPSVASSTPSTQRTRAATRKNRRPASSLNQVRQLRSRTVLLPSEASVSAVSRPSNISTGQLGSNNCTVRGRRRSQSRNSSRLTEDNVCSVANTRRTSGRTDPKTKVFMTTRSSARVSRSRSARITVPNSSSNLRRLAGNERASSRSVAVVSTFNAQNPRNISKNTVTSVGNRGSRNKQVLPEQGKFETLSQTGTSKDSNEQVGCQCVSSRYQVPLPNFDSHLLHCDLRAFPCPLTSEKCKWAGTLKEAVDHIHRNHSAVNHETGPNAQLIVQNWKTANAIEWTTLQTCLGQNFLVVVQKIDKSDRFSQFYGTVKIFGRQEDADRFEFRMTLRTSARKFSYSTVVRTLHEGNSTLSEEDCFIFDSSHAALFSNDETLVLDVSISVMKM